MAKVEIFADKCTGCAACLAKCPFGALSLEGNVAVANDLCTACGVCLKACDYQAMKLDRPKKKKPADVSGYKGVWVFLEQREGQAARVAWELLGEGARLARQLDVEVAGVLLGHNVGHLAKEAMAYGAQTVYLIDNPILESYRTLPYTKAMVELIRKHHPEIVLLGATATGRDLAGTVATELQTGLTADCTGLSIDKEKRLLEQTRPTFGGNILATILCPGRRPQMATVRPRVLPLPQRLEVAQEKVFAEELDLAEESVPTKLLEFIRDEAGCLGNLEDAEVIVAGGRGMAGPKNFALLEELAETMGGTVAASRGAVDAGWISPEHQVGQTGRTVRPRLYVAVGISGAIQHVMGMQNSDVIVAINKDPRAPIFKIATYGIVGDLFEVVPALAHSLRERLGKDGGNPNIMSVGSGRQDEGELAESKAIG